MAWRGRYGQRQHGAVVTAVAVQRRYSGGTRAQQSVENQESGLPAPRPHNSHHATLEDLSRDTR